MAFEVQELPDVIRIIVLLELSKGKPVRKEALRRRIDKVCTRTGCVEISEIDKALQEMSAEKLVIFENDYVRLSEQGLRLGKEWESLLLKKDPILEVVAGMVDGSITGLVVVLSAFIAFVTGNPALSALSTIIFAAFLTLSAVAVTNFSSFFLGGITEDLADILTLQTLINYSLSDIPDKAERDKSLLLVKRLFSTLDREIHRSNLYAAVICATTTFLAGFIPISAYLTLPTPFNVVLSVAIIAAVAGFFLVRYRSKKTRVHWKITLLETVAIVAIATVVSLVLGLV